MNRWICISKIVATVICVVFAIITIVFYLNGVGGDYVAVCAGH